MRTPADGTIVFKVMRLIDYRILDVPGVGRVWIRFDLKYGRTWAGRLE